MLIPQEKYQSIIIENKSKFISLLYPLKDKDEYKIILDEVKKEYKDATHHCYGMIFDGYAKCDDDGEPKGTAGHPILKIMQTKDLNHCLLVVVRYFGGTKLGAGKLLRTYVKAAASVANLVK